MQLPRDQLQNNTPRVYVKGYVQFCKRSHLNEQVNIPCFYCLSSISVDIHKVATGSSMVEDYTRV